EVGHVLVALGGVFAERFFHDSFEVGWQIWSHAGELNRLAMQDVVEQLGVGRPAKWRSSARHLIKDASERKDIAPRVERAHQRLLGRHVRESTSVHPTPR